MTSTRTIHTQDDQQVNANINNSISFNSQKSSRSTPVATMTTLDLQVIDDTFGKNADLYEDVLRVPTTATQDEIQLAYFDRRSELFTLLAKIDAAIRVGPQSESSASMASADQRRYNAEQKMDSVVFAVRILADPNLRIAYDEIRPERTGIAASSSLQLLPVSASASGGYTLQHTHSAATTGSSAPISRSSSAASGSVSSAMSNNHNHNHNSKNNQSPRRMQRSQDLQASSTQEYHQQSSQLQQQQPPRVVTPTESPPMANATAATATASSAVSETKNWIQSTFSSSLFSSLGSNSNSKAEDDMDDNNVDENNNNNNSSSNNNNGQNREGEFEQNNNNNNNNPARKQKRRQKQQQPSSTSLSPSSSTPDRDAAEQPVSENHHPEKEKKYMWGRKKRKKKKQRKEGQNQNGGISLNDSMDTNATDTSLTDNEDIHRKNNNKNIKDFNSNRPTVSMQSSTSNTTGYDDDDDNGNRYSPPDAMKRGERRSKFRREEIVEVQTIDTIDDEAETIDDDTTRRDDDTRTFLGDDGETFATASVFSNAEDEERLHGKAECGKNGMFGCLSGSKTFKRITDELSGACEDTLVSVDMVLNAFTLTDKDIKAVTKKIHKAKRQLDS